MDVETLYNMAKAVARGAEKALEAPSTDKDMLTRFIGYPAYVSEYNKLIPHATDLFGEEARSLFAPIDLGSYTDPWHAAPVLQKYYLDLVSARLSALAAYLQSKTSSTDQAVQSLVDLIELNLRSAIFSKPERETEVQNALEVIFRARGLEFRREKVVVEYSSKNFVPDFTLDTLDTALDVKLCGTARREKEIVDEINADIPAYQTKYRRALFVVFDLGFIRDVARFRSGIEGNPDVRVLVIKM